tara:strand:- start:2169 stop:2429 length:261 start_codon:yes stop_codon:yes gene_type:complete
MEMETEIEHIKYRCKKDFIDPHGNLLFRKDVWYGKLDSSRKGKQGFIELMAEILEIPFIIFEHEMEKHFYSIDELRELEINKILEQ